MICLHHCAFLELSLQFLHSEQYNYLFPILNHKICLIHLIKKNIQKSKFSLENNLLKMSYHYATEVLQVGDWL